MINTDGDILGILQTIKRALLGHTRNRAEKSGLVGGNWNMNTKRFEWEQWPFPHYWREEANSLEEYVIRYARAVGLHARHDILTGDMIFRLTIDEADEAEITWPGKIGVQQ